MSIQNKNPFLKKNKIVFKKITKIRPQSFTDSLHSHYQILFIQIVQMEKPNLTHEFEILVLECLWHNDYFIRVTTELLESE